MRLPKDAKLAIRSALDAGCRLECGKKHSKLRSPDGARFVTLCSSPSDADYIHILRRQIRNLLREAT